LSLRALFLLLLFANLAFLGWAELIDVPPEPPPSDSISHLPQLKLLSEVRHSKVEAPASAPRSDGSTSNSAGAASQTGASVAPGSAPTSRLTPTQTQTPASAPRRAASGDAAAPAGTRGLRADPPAGLATAGTNYPTAADASDRCITVGPFTAGERVREAMDLLRERGFSPRPRIATSAPPRGYWVYIGGLKSLTDETRVVQHLEHNGISDAKAMPPSDGAHRVSVGLFSARDGAERRARAVRRLGLDAEIAPREADLAHWVDVNLDSSGQSLPAEGLLALQADGSRLEIKPCASTKGAPAGPQSPANAPDFKPRIPKPLTADGRPRPG
jgi:cell division septation protein DedD